MNRSHREFLTGILVGALLASAVACAGAKQQEAEALHLAQLGHCIDVYASKTAADSCIEEVQRNWGRLPDGGRLPVDGGVQ
jgi:gas vesicle protein